MSKNDTRNRQRGDSQQKAYTQNERQQGWHETSRQPQGDYGWGRDYAPLGSGNDNEWRRQQDNTQGAFRDSENRDDWRDSRNAQVPYYAREQDERYGQYGSRRTHGGGGQYSDDRSDFGNFGRDYGYGQRDRDDQQSRAFDHQERDRSQRPSGLDRDYRAAGYAGPGGYGGGFGGEGNVRQRDREQGHDADYSQWRREQMRALDDDYDQWRQDRFKKFSDEFTTWRSSRSQEQSIGKDEAGSTPGKPKKDAS